MSEQLSKLEQLTLVLLYQSAFDERGDLRSWKGYDWGVMNRLHEKGLITDPVGKTKSVFLTEEGRRQGELFAGEYLGPTQARPSPKGATCDCGCGEPRPSGGFVPGHDQKLRAQLEARVGGLLALRDLIDAVEGYAHGQSTTEELTRELRALFARME